jgi:hypothetical protein
VLFLEPLTIDVPAHCVDECGAESARVLASVRTAARNFDLELITGKLKRHLSGPGSGRRNLGSGNPYFIPNGDA